MNIDDQDDIETKEWEEALSLVENIFRDFKENSAESEEQNSDLLDVARWKVVWGKKPAQYRLKPFLMWSVDEMPSIPEECESSSEKGNRPQGLLAEEVNEIIKIKREKQLRFLKRKMFKMKRRIDEINVLLAKTLSDDAAARLRDEDPTKAATILQLEAQRIELLNERSIIREKLRKFHKKLMTLKGPAVEANGISGGRQDVGDTLRPMDTMGTNADEHTPSGSDPHAGEPWSFKSCRRSAIKKDCKSTWNKPLAKEMPRSSCDVTADRKFRKKRCCKGHHKRHEIQTGETARALERPVLSESDLTSGASDRETSQHKQFETHDGVDKGKKYELHASRSSEHKALTTDRGTRGKDRMSQVRSAQEISSGSRGPRPRRNSSSEGAVARYDREADDTTNTSGSQMQGNNLRMGLKKDNNRTFRSATDVGAEDQKRSQEQTKHWRTKRSSSTKDGRAVRTTYTRTKPVDNKDFTFKSRSTKCAENASRVDQPEVSGKRIPISNVPS